MGTSFASLLPALAKLGTYFSAGMEHYVELRASGTEITPDILAMFIHAKMEGWKPTVKSKNIFDHETAVAASRFLAGVIINLAPGQES
tara:strand:+ start:608 stop:871 length:264 start_codon:yes stop_codon:yes gene_type:complete